MRLFFNLTIDRFRQRTVILFFYETCERSQEIDTTARILTAKRLRECNVFWSGYIRLFVDLFGEQVQVTSELCEKHAEDFCWFWDAKYLITKHLLTEEGFYRFYDICYKAYDNLYKVRQNERKKYYDKYYDIDNEAWENALKKWVGKKRCTRDERAAVLDEYLDIEQAAWDEHMIKCSITYKEFAITVARAFAEIYNSEEV